MVSDDSLSDISNNKSGTATPDSGSSADEDVADIIVIPKLSPFVLMIMQLLDQNLSVF